MKFNIKYNKKEIISYFILSIWTIIISFQCSVNPLKNGNCGTDSGVFRYMAYAMKQGLTMYKDSFDHKGPMIYWINYLGMSISFWRGIWLLELITLMSSIFLTYKISRLFHKRKVSLLINFIIWSMIFVFFERGNLVEEYALPFITASLFIYIDYYHSKRVTNFRLVICGASFMVVCLLRPNMAGLWVVFCCAILIENIIRCEWKKIGRFIAYFTLGCVIVLLPNIFYLLKNNAMSDFIQQFFSFNILYSKGPQLNFWNTVKHFLAYPIIFVSFLIVLVAVFRDKKESRILHIVYLVSMVFVFLLTCMSGRIYGHYAMILIPMTVYPFCILFSNTEELTNNFSTWVIIVGVFLLAVIPFWNQGIKRVVECYQTRNIVSKGSSIDSILSVISHNSEENDLITVYGNKDSIYVLGNRLSASKYSYQYPISTSDPRILDEYFEDLEKTKPKLVILDRQMDERMEKFLRKNKYIQISNIEDCNIWQYNE